MITAQVQSDLFTAALAVWAGYFGNGEERIENLLNYGYEPEKVQVIVNMLGEVFKKCRELENEF